MLYMSIRRTHKKRFEYLRSACVVNIKVLTTGIFIREVDASERHAQFVPCKNKPMCLKYYK